ncbi:MAG: PASTA domain-containing protein [Gemmatimonadaceae bacterium]
MNQRAAPTPPPARSNGRKRARAWLPYAVASASGFLLAFALVALVLFPSDDAPQEVRVPSVMGLPYPDAERRLKSLGLIVTLGAERESADAPRNAVVAQSPVAGDAVNVGAEIVLDVSAGQPQTIAIPAVVGVSRDEADRLLRAAGLTVGDVTEQPSDSARGLVLAATPAPGASVPAGTRVGLVVSAGPVELSLPDVVGRELGMARGTLDQLGLVVAPIEYDSLSSLPAGTVIAQSPAAGAAITAGSTVTLRVSGRP